MKKLTYNEIRTKYLAHLEKHKHTIIPSASLVPENDPTVLYVNSGMFPLVPFLMGESHPAGTRIADSQRCLRTIDIDEVGDPHHCTTFEMLGNWSLNDYFKDEAIRITASFVNEHLGVEMEDIYASAYAGEPELGIPQDDEAIQTWKELFAEHGIDAKVGKGGKIQLFTRKCWWGLESGGPCGPCSEIFFDTHKEPCGPECNVNCDCGKFLEIGNNVFMQFLKKDGEYLPLGRHNVDFGGGLDRLAMISQGADSFYNSDIYKPIYDKVKELAKISNIKSERIVTDHIKGATWIIMDGVEPGRSGREYILRRIIRRAIRHAMLIGIEERFVRTVGEIAIKQFSSSWPQLIEKQEHILAVLAEEEDRFRTTLKQGLKEVEKIITGHDGGKFQNEAGESFKIFESYGFPAEMFIEEMKNRGIEVDETRFWENHNAKIEEHQNRSRSASKGMFKGGLADTSEASTKLHTATHLLLAALYKVVGPHIYQKGSNITPERLRLDFPNEAKLSDQQLKQVEELVNAQIEKDLPVSYVEMSKDEALEKVPYAAFDEKYGEVVKVYTIGEDGNPFSIEICGGPHVKKTGELGRFKIIKQENVAAGIKRIKAVLE